MSEQISMAGEHVDTLTRLATSICLENLPSSVTHAGRRILIDSTAVMLAGIDQKPILSLAEQMATNSINPDSTILGSIYQCDAAWAALVNGTAAVWHNLAPGHRFSGGHPAIPAVSAGLAVAEREHVSGKRFLEAIIAGYEVGARVGLGTTLRPGMHPNGSWTVVGAAITAGLLMGYSDAELREAMNVSTSLNLATSCKTAYEGATVLSIYAGFSAAMGVLAADLVSDGFTAERDGISTVFGNIAGVFFDTDRAMEGIGERWEIERGYHTTYACDRRIHPALDALIALANEEDIIPEHVDRIEVRTYAAAATLNNNAPENPAAAKSSIPYALASYLLLKDPGVSAYHETAIHDSRIQDLSMRVILREAPELNELTPTERPVTVRVTFRNGRKLKKTQTLPMGEFDTQPLGDDQLSEKFRAFASKSLNPESTAKMIDMLWHIENVPNVRAFIALGRKS